jgi:hypothetical protein
MLLNFGKHRGMPVESLVLKEPDYVAWMLAQEDAGRELSAARAEVVRLIRILDAKPVLVPCRGCGGRATRFSLYEGSVRPRWWCDQCDPGEECPSPAKVHTVRTYLGGAHYVGSYCGGRKRDLALLIKELARAKGLPDRVGENDAMGFFYVPGPRKGSSDLDACWDEPRR